MFTIDEFFEIGVPHTIINPVSGLSLFFSRQIKVIKPFLGEEVTAVIELTSEGVLNSVM